MRQWLWALIFFSACGRSAPDRAVIRLVDEFASAQIENIAAPAGPPEGRGAYPPAPSGPPPAFDDDALAAALEADIATYTQPVSIVPPAPPTPVQSPAYETEYEAPDVPEYVVPPAPPVPDYVVPPAPGEVPWR